MEILFLILFYVLMSVISYIFWYWWGYKQFKKSGYKDFDAYLEREWGYSIVLLALVWPATLIIIIIFMPIDYIQEFIRNKIEK